MEELIKKSQNGNKEAFTELMLLFKNDLYKIAKIRLKNDDDVYDVIQETMIVAFKSIKKLKQVQSFKSWIITILISQSNLFYRKKSKENIIFLEEMENNKNIIYPNSNLENIEITLDFDFICKNLKYEEKMIIILYYMEKFTDKEIGEILHLKENTVKTKRTRAKQEIRNILEKGRKIYG